MCNLFVFAADLKTIFFWHRKAEQNRACYTQGTLWRSVELGALCEFGNGSLHTGKHDNSSGINSNPPPPPPPAWQGGLNIHHSLHSVCVQGCRLSDVSHCGLGSDWAGVSTFTFAPRDLYWGDRKHTSVKRTGLSCTKSYLVRLCVCVCVSAEVSDEANTNTRGMRRQENTNKASHTTYNLSRILVQVQYLMIYTWCGIILEMHI